MSYSEIKGDLIKMAQNGQFDIIVHGCNCFCTMGSGIAKRIKQEFPGAYRADCCTKKGGDKVGRFTWASFGDLIVINAYTQKYYGGDFDHFDYNGFLAILRQLDIFASRGNRRSRIGFPKIGAGLAGGDWNRIREMIREHLSNHDVTVVIYES